MEFIKRTLCLIVCLSLQAPLGVCAQEMNATHIIAQQLDNIYVISETDGNIEKYAQSLSKNAEEFTQLLSNKDFDPQKEIQKGNTLLHAAAKFGLYTFIEVLLNNPNTQTYLNTPNDDGLTPLDLAKMRTEVSLLFINPSITEDPFSFVPYAVTQSFYDGELLPYEKTIQLLESKGAKTSRSLKASFKITLNKVLEGADATINKVEQGLVNQDPEIMKDLSAMNMQTFYYTINTLKDNLKMLDELATDDDNQVYSAIQNHVRAKFQEIHKSVQSH